MPETPSGDGELSTDIAGALVARLEAGAQLVDRGRFTLDYNKARDKLAERRLAELDRFVLLLVELAHLLPGCTGVRFEISAYWTQAQLGGVALTKAELHTIFDALFVDLSGLEPAEARRQQARQRLASAVDAALSLPGASVELHTHARDHSPIRWRLASDGSSVIEERPSPLPAPSLSFRLRRRRDAAGARAQRTLLSRDAIYARVPVELDGTPLDIGLRLVDVPEPSEVRGPDGRVVGLAGWSAARALATLIFVANGVVVERLTRARWRSGFVALVEADDLPRDVSLFKLRRNQAFDARLAAVEAVHDGLQAPLVANISYAQAERTNELNRAWVVAFSVLTLVYAMGTVFILSILDPVSVPSVALETGARADP